MLTSGRRRSASGRSESGVKPRPPIEARDAARGRSAGRECEPCVRRVRAAATTPEAELELQQAPGVGADDNKRAYVDRSKNCLDLGVFGGQNVDADVRNRSSWTGWTVILTLPR